MAVVFVLVVSLIAGVLHAYLWLRLVRSTTRRGSRARRIGTVAIVALMLLLFGTLIGTRMLPRTMGQILGWPGYLWLAAMFYLLVILLLLEIPALVARLVLRRRQNRAPSSGDALPDPGRRLFVARSVALAAGLTAAGTVGYGTAIALGPPVRSRVSIRLAKLPRRRDGFRIAVFSDLHLGPTLGARHAERVVEAINGFDADVVAVIGDLVDGSIDDLRASIEPLRGLHSRLGAYFVTGNHEYYSGYRDWIEYLPSLGLRPLRNQRVDLDGLAIAGVNDLSGEQHGDPPDYDQALSGHDPDVPVVLLAHQPVQAHEAARRGVDLQLSGHTHDGQMWPFSLLVGLVQPVRAGLGTVDGMPVYVTRGAGFWGPPVRVGAPPDVTLIELRAP